MLALVACAEEVDPNPPRVRDAGPVDPGPSSIFKQACGRCHGPRGEGSGVYPRLPGDRDEATFIALVRSGGGDMPAFGPDVISDAELSEAYVWLTTKRQ